MTGEQIKTEIKISIKAFSSGTLSANALNFFNVLGYVTERQAPLEKPTFAIFSDAYINDKKFDIIKAKVNEWKYVDLLFQLSKEEVLKQTSLFDTKQVDRTIIETYLFFCVELEKNQYSRTELSLITREVNRLFPMPAMILFKHGNKLTLSIINRRLHKRDETKDVLEKVTLIKDINISSPHRAHIEILFDLSFDELTRNFQFTNFVELHNAWQKTLDTKLLNKKFFEELSNWYFWSQQHVEFPNDRKLEEGKNVQINLIRLITRMIFVWFLKEKNLVPEKLFDKNEIKKLLRSFDPNSDKIKTYYTAILQNLFFGTLNQPMNKREFAKDGDFNTNRDEHGIKTKYRYAKHFSIPESEIINLFSSIPFLNGGLFDCLDKDNEETGKHEYVDGFSREERKTAKVPDLLFFGNERTLDLSEGYGYKRNKEKCRGLFEIFNDYKFTIEENTPIEEEIALDPELLGKVFENLLAYYNPETETTARKQTGSFYTPREIVNYMVDESLIAYLKTQMLEDKPSWLQLGNLQTELFGNETRKGQLKLEQSLNKGTWKERKEELETNLRKLISYSNDEHPFTDEEDIQQLIYAIDHCKILDPACGSGAFPMGILHKLVYVLGRLDENNVLWRELQKRKAEIEIDKALNEIDKKEREKKLIDINESFEDNASDYGRKLYLIENCIYGVDIQPIAAQISKLRFFISLVVDQKEKQGVNNRGIRPLPNLETKFVAANTLIGLEKPAQLPIGYHLIEPLQTELQQVRHKHFEAKSRKDKLKCQKEDKVIRNKISEQLKKLGFENKDADKIARFDIYDQNSSSDWFEPEWMYGKDLSKGFDIVIGNPPYIFTRDADFTDEFKDYIAKKYFAQLAAKKVKSRANQSGKINLFALFILRGLFDLQEKGNLIYIVPNNLLRTTTYDLVRKYLLENSLLEEIVDLGSGVFENVTASTIIFRISKKKNTVNHTTKIVTNINDLEKNDFDTSAIPQSQFLRNESYTINIFSNSKIETIINSLNKSQKLLMDDFEICAGGIATGPDKTESISKSKLNEKYKPLVEGKDVKPYSLNYRGLFIEYDRKKLYRAREEFIFLLHEKLVTQRIGGGENPIVVAYDNEQFYTFNSTNTIYSKVTSKTPIKFLLAILNSRLINWLYSTQFSNKSNLTVNISKTFLDKIPIANASKEYQATVVNIVNYILLLKKQHMDSAFFERLINSIMYELYLTEAIQNAKCEVLKHLSTLPALKEGADEKNLKMIEKIYKELSDPNHPVSVAIFKMDTIEEIRVIEGKQ